MHGSLCRFSVLYAMCLCLSWCVGDFPISSYMYVNVSYEQLWCHPVTM